jgi:DNA-binding CsgD family transcriptional regulator
MTQELRNEQFAAADIEKVIGIMQHLCIPPSRMSFERVIREMTLLLRAECACVYETRGSHKGLFTELCRQNWRDWQTDALAHWLSGMRIPSATKECIQLTLPTAPGTRKSNEIWHCIASTLPAAPNYLLTLAFARRAQQFNQRESFLLRHLHKSGIFGAMSKQKITIHAKDLSQRLREVLGGLLHGQAEKQIAGDLRLSLHTVHGYVKAVYRRYGVNTRGELLSLLIDPAAKDAMTR